MRISDWSSDVCSSDLMERLGQPGVNPEGRFFPDTYRFVRGMSDLDLLKQAYTRLESVLEEEWAERAEGLPYKTTYDALIYRNSVVSGQSVSERVDIGGRRCIKKTKTRTKMKIS